MRKNKEKQRKTIKEFLKNQTVQTTILLCAMVAIFIVIFIGGICIIFKPYTITMDLGDGTEPLVQKYSIRSGDITLGIPERDGLRFTGWTGSNGSKPQRDITIKNGKIGDLTYTANWSDDLTVTCQDWLIDKNGNHIREITSEVDKFLNDGGSAKNYKAQDRTITVKPGTKVNATKWGDDKSYKAYSDQYMFVSTSGEVAVNTDETIVYRYFYPILDVNYTVNGSNVSSLDIANSDVAFFDLYIDGEVVSENIYDYCATVPYGSKYEVVIKSTTLDYTLDELSISSGYMPDSRVNLPLNFVYRTGEYKVTCEDWLIDADGNRVREITSDVDRYLSNGKSSKSYPVQERTVAFNSGEEVSGELWGADTSNNAYSSDYVYVSSSDSITATKNGQKVYRYFYPVLDVGADINGTMQGNTNSIARFNVYVDNKLVAENVTDFFQGIPVNSQYNIEMAEYTSYNYILQPSRTDSGTIGKYKRSLYLKFIPRSGDAYVTIQDWLVDKNNNLVREITDEVDTFLSADKSRQKYTLQPRVIKANIGDTIDPALFGNDDRARSYADDYVYAGASDSLVIEGTTTTIYRYFYPVLDANAIVDGESRGNTIGVATFSIFVDGRYVDSNIEDFFDGVPCGSTYEIRRISVEDGYEYVDEGLSSGVMGDETTSVFLTFNTIGLEEEITDTTDG